MNSLHCWISEDWTSGISAATDVSYTTFVDSPIIGEIKFLASATIVTSGLLGGSSLRAFFGPTGVVCSIPGLFNTPAALDWARVGADSLGGLEASYISFGLLSWAISSSISFLSLVCLACFAWGTLGAAFFLTGLDAASFLPPQPPFAETNGGTTAQNNKIGQLLWKVKPCWVQWLKNEVEVMKEKATQIGPRQGFPRGSRVYYDILEHLARVPHG